MTVEYRTGNLFEQWDLEAIGHGVNCKGKMGSGIAKDFKRHFPDMYLKYAGHCKKGSLKPGMVFPWHDPRTDFWVFNMATQDYPGKNATLKAVNETIRKTLAFSESKGLKTIGLPRIGAGIGGLDWDNVRKILEKAANESTVTLVIVSLPDRGALSKRRCL